MSSTVLDLSISNITSGPIAITLGAKIEFLSIGANAEAVTINGGPHGMTLGGGKAVTGNGGAINYGSTLANSSADLSVNNVTFTNNSAVDGGAIYAGPQTGPVNVIGCTFGSSTIPGNAATGNSGTAGNGGAIDYEGSNSLTITNTSFVDNTAGNSGTAGNGGAVEVEGPNATSATLTNCQFGTSVGSGRHPLLGNSLQEQGNTATSNGGAIDYEGLNSNSSSLTLTDVAFLQNEAGDGGARNHHAGGQGTGTVNVLGSYFGNVVPITGGGGIAPPLQFFDGNSATTAGGAIYDLGASSLTINSTSFLVNEAEGGGGGAIYDSSYGNLTIGNNSVFTSSTWR